MKKFVLILTVLTICSAGSAVGSPSKCAKGQSEAVLVTDNGSIQMCVDDELIESAGPYAALEIQAATCPCAAYLPSAKEWNAVKDERECTNSANGLMIKAMSENRSRKSSNEEVWTFESGVAGGSCVFQIRVDGVLHQSNRYFVPSEAAAQACRTLAIETFSSIESRSKSPSSCPAQ